MLSLVEGVIHSNLQVRILTHNSKALKMQQKCLLPGAASYSLQPDAQKKDGGC